VVDVDTGDRQLPAAIDQRDCEFGPSASPEADGQVLLTLFRLLDQQQLQSELAVTALLRMN